MRTAGDGARALLEALRAEGGSLAASVAGHLERHDGELDEPGPAQIAASGPRAEGFESEYELLLEMILEGARLHYGAARVARAADPDLALLLGDQLYALGLARLSALGDVEAVRELADVISLIAEAHAAADGGLAEAVWSAGAVAIGWGPTPAHENAKALARASDPRARAALRAAAAAVLRGGR